MKRNIACNYQPQFKAACEQEFLCLRELELWSEEVNKLSDHEEDSVHYRWWPISFIYSRPTQL